MSESQAILSSTAESIFGDIGGRKFADAWPSIAEAAFATLLVPEESGGFGGDWSDVSAVQRAAGSHALSLPIGESIVAAYLVTGAGFEVSDEPMSIAARAEGTVWNERFSGTLRGVPWGAEVVLVVAVLSDKLLIVHPGDASVERAVNAAGEPRDTLSFDAAPARLAPCRSDLQSLGAFLRVAQAAGALEAALALTIDHANTRVQFGKPLGKLQAVQQSLAIAAGEALAVDAAAHGAAAALDRGDSSLEIAAAKLRTNIAIGTCTSIVHQVHGAIGFTQEYPLHRFTRRLMSWRSEYGNDRYWSHRLGQVAAGLGGAGLWAELARRTDPP